MRGSVHGGQESGPFEINSLPVGVKDLERGDAQEWAVADALSRREEPVEGRGAGVV